MRITIGKLVLFSLAYLLLPHLIFILGWVQAVWSIPAMLLLLFLSFRVSRNTLKNSALSSAFSLSRTQLLYFIGFSILVTAFAGIGELVWQRDDFFKHNLIFSDLLRSDWAVIFNRTEPDTMLTYYLGWYLVPAAIGKIGGVWATAFFSFLWTAAGLFLFFVWFKSLVKTTHPLLWLVFVGISGFEFLWVAGHYIFYVFNYYPQYGLLGLLQSTFNYTRSELITPYLNQNIPSFFVGFLSAPQHLIPGLLGTAIVIQAIRSKWQLGYSVLVFSLTVFWSPLVAIGLFPFVLHHAYLRLSSVFSVQNLWLYAPSAVLLFFVVSYLLAHSPIDNKAFVWQIGLSSWWFYTLVFIALKFGVIYSYLWYKNKKLAFMGSYKVLGILSVITLILLSFYKFGAYNDLIARASIPAYFVLLLLVIFFLKEISQYPLRKYALVWGVIALMLLPRLWQVYKTVAYTPQMERKPYKISDVPREYSILDHNTWLIQVKPEYANSYVIDKNISRQYLGSTHSFFYQYLAKKNELEN